VIRGSRSRSSPFPHVPILQLKQYHETPFYGSTILYNTFTINYLYNINQRYLKYSYQSCLKYRYKRNRLEVTKYRNRKTILRNKKCITLYMHNMYIAQNCTITVTIYTTTRIAHFTVPDDDDGGTADRRARETLNIISSATCRAESDRSGSTRRCSYPTAIIDYYSDETFNGLRKRYHCNSVIIIILIRSWV